MANCISCGRHYFLSPFNQTPKCDNCLDILEEDFANDEDAEVELDHLVNKSRRTPFHIDDDNDTDSFSS